MTHPRSINCLKKQVYLHLIPLLVTIFFITSSSATFAQTTQTFDNIGKNNLDIITDGSDIGGFKFETEADKGMLYDNSGIGYSGTSGLFPNSPEPGDVTWITLTKSDNSKFKFISIWIGSTLGDAQMKAYGFLDGAIVNSSTNIAVGLDATHTFNWDNVDSIKFETPMDMYSLFDQLVIDDPVVPNAIPTADAKTLTTIVNSAKAVTLSGTDTDGTISGYSITQAAHGTVTLSGTTATYTPTTNYIGADSFTYTVTDNNGATSIAATITITVVNSIPTITTNNILNLDEGASKCIPLDSLESDDTSTDNSTLTYTITASPNNGQVENTDNSGVSISSFTQQNLIDGKIQYVHDETNTTSDAFTFKVSNGFNELTGQTFIITVNAIDDDTPTIITNNGLKLDEGATKSIPLDSLEADDTDTDNSILVYTVTSTPSNGQLENTNNPEVAISSFTQQNLIDGKIQYVHDDGNTTSDSFTFKVADGTPNELTGQTFNITVKAIDDDTPTIITNNGLKLDEGAAKSIPLNSLEADDTDTDNSILVYTVTSTPSNGQLENTDNSTVPINSFTQQNLTDGKIQYIHDGSNTTSDSFVFKVADGTPNELTGQTFNITVKAIDDDTPTIITNNGLKLDEGAAKSIPLNSLEADDTDTDNSILVYTVTSTPSNGQLENTDNSTVAINSFTQQNLTDGKIQYVHDGSNTTSDSFTFKVADGTPNELTGQTFNITVKAIDDDSPTIITNNGLKLDEGAAKSIPLNSLEADDTDTDNSILVYTVTSTPSNGQLENTDNSTVAINSFTQQNLIDGKIQYVHDDGNTTSDSFTFKVADGTPNELTGQTFNITVKAIDDDTPTIITNNGLKLDEGAAKSIPLNSLEADDTDTDNSILVYTVTSTPSNGQLENTDNPEVAISSFTQQNLIDGKIRYVHDGSNTTSDSFVFKVADGTPNELTGQTFTITINVIDDDSPTIITNNGLKLDEGAAKSIPLNSLEADDTDTDNSILVYTVTSAPSNGQLENTDNPEVAISSFTQQNLIDGKIQYVHDDGNTTSDSFTFKVADGTPNELTGQTFNITVNAIDDDTPTIITNNGLKLDEGAAKSIPLNSLEADDTDTDNSILVYTVTSTPSNGQLENTDNSTVAINSFTQQNLIDGKIRYVHDDSETTSDSFVFKVADGTPNELTGQTFSITITDVNDHTPSIIASQSFSVDENAANNASVGTMMATDADAGTSFSNWTITSGNDDGIFEINTATGEITIADNSNLDFETTTSYALEISVSDGTNTSLLETVSVTINDINDNTPVVTASQSFSVDENTANTASVGTVLATDADAGTSFSSWTITSGNTDAVFAIDAATGEITIADNSNLDFEASESYALEISASDGTNTSAAENVIITVNNINDNTPVVTAGQSFSVDENAANNASVGTIMATDADAGTTFSNWTIAGGNTDGIFEINTATGEITIADNTNLDFETTTSYALEISASDGTNTSLPETVSLTINDINDELPVITASQSFSVNENTANTTSVGTVLATDADAGTSFSSWTITSGNDDAIFEINTATGEITIADNTNLDFETTTSYTLSVTVSDGTNTNLPETVSVTINDINDELPVVTASQSFSVNEDAVNTTSVGTVLASDADAGTTFSNWTIAGGNTDGIFEINAATGEITIADNSNLDFKTTQSYALEISLSDGTNTSAAETVIVDINDVNEAPTALAGENQAVAGEVIATLDGSASTDPEGDELSYYWTAPEGITLSDINAAQPTFTTPKLNETTDIEFSLIVNDGEFDSQESIVTISVQLTTGINDFAKNSEIILYPNPSKGKFAIRLAETPQNGAMFTLSNLNGQIIHKKTIYEKETWFNLSLAPGLYLITIVQDNKIRIKKLLIQ